MIWLDTETYSEVPINHGTYKYTSNCEAMIWTSALDGGPVIAIDLTNDEHPYDVPDLKYALEDPEQLATAHNSMFDRNVLRYSKNLKLEIAIRRWRCTMVQAFTLALPGSLDKLCQIFKVNDDLAKMKDGKRLINLFCKPRPKNMKLRRATRLTHPEDWASFIQYAINDTAAMREVAKKMPTWNYKGNELALWHLDQEVNDRGFAVDLELAHAALKAVDLEQAYLRAKTCEITKTEAAPKGAVQSTTQRDVLLEHILESFGFSLPNLTKDTVERIIDDPDVPDGLRELLKVRLQASTSSTSKYTKLIKATTDGRLRGTIQFCGAGRTGRAAGRTFQPQNLPRPNMKNAAIERGIDALKAGCADLIYNNVMSLTSNAIRGCIVAPPGKKLVVSDLSNIEGRAVAYLAGEEWKLQAFRDFDAGIGEDLYKVAYGKAFNVSPKTVGKDSPERQVGKVMELMCFGPNTQVLTDSGVKGIVEVLDTDKLWDGIEWVRHGGMVARGAKKVVLVSDMWVTPDHLILTKQTWTQAQQLASNASTLYQALETGSENLPSSVLENSLSSKWHVPVAHQRTLSTTTTCAKGCRHAAVNALANSPDIGERITTGTPTSSKIKDTARACFVGFLPVSTAAETQKMAGITTTVLGALRCIQRGLKTVGSFFGMSLPCLVGTYRNLNWTELTLIKGTNPETYVSLPAVKIKQIKERCKVSRNAFENLKNKFEIWSPVYDLLLAGPRSRFTVITEAGPLIVHNCGYGGGVGAYLTGAATYRIDLDHMTKMARPGIPDEIWNEAVKFWHWSHKTKRSTYGLGHDVFCACDSLKRMWRLQHPAIESFWAEIEDVVRAAIREPKVTFLCRKLKVRRTGEWLRIVLPSGRALCYPSPRVNDKGVISYEGVNQFSRKWCRMNTYGGRLVENVVQAFARDVFYNAKFPAEAAGYKLVLEVHDEFITEVPDTEEHNVDGLSWILATNPPWAEGMPLAAAGFETYRYRKG